MEKDRIEELHGNVAPVRLRYPLEDWIEQLLRKYPDELDSIRPEKTKSRSLQLKRMKRSLQERARRSVF